MLNPIATKMGRFEERFTLLKQESDEYFYKEFESDEAEERENIRIKTGLLALISEAKDTGNEALYTEQKRNVITYLCDVCGHSGDLEILKNHTPEILSPEELEYIIQNSALSRWF